MNGEWNGGSARRRFYSVYLFQFQKWSMSIEASKFLFHIFFFIGLNLYDQKEKEKNSLKQYSMAASVQHVSVYIQGV